VSTRLAKLTANDNIVSAEMCEMTCLSIDVQGCIVV
jgi:hypothetical protein